jgi:hypothetical protein
MADSLDAEHGLCDATNRHDAPTTGELLEERP